MRPAGAFRFVTLFNLQGTRRFRRNIWYYTKSTSVCQVLFSSFLKNFCFIFCLTAVHATAWLDYHTSPHLSTPFFKFFEIFLYLLEVSPFRQKLYPFRRRYAII